MKKNAFIIFACILLFLRLIDSVQKSQKEIVTTYRHSRTAGDNALFIF